MKSTRSLPALMLGASLLCLAPVALTACHSDTSTVTRANQNLSLGVTASRTVINQGEVVTYMVQDKGTLGKDIGIKWRSTGGKIDVSDNSRVAHVQFEKPGTYTVFTDFTVDGNKYKTVSNVVTVNALPQ